MLRQVSLLGKRRHAHKAALHCAVQPRRVQLLPCAAGPGGAAAAGAAAATISAAHGAAKVIIAVASAMCRRTPAIHVEALSGRKASHLGEQVCQLCRIHLATVIAAHVTVHAG